MLSRSSVPSSHAGNIGKYNSNTVGLLPTRARSHGELPHGEFPPPPLSSQVQKHLAQIHEKRWNNVGNSKQEPSLFPGLNASTSCQFPQERPPALTRTCGSASALQPPEALQPPQHRRLNDEQAMPHSHQAQQHLQTWTFAGASSHDHDARAHPSSLTFAPGTPIPTATASGGGNDEIQGVFAALRPNVLTQSGNHPEGVDSPRSVSDAVTSAAEDSN